MLKKNKLYTVKSWYEFGDPSEQLSQFTFQDTEFPNQKVEQPSMKKSFSFAFQPAMEVGTVKVKGVASNLDKTKYEETPEMEVAKGVITTSRLYAVSLNPLYVAHKYNNQEELIPNNVKFVFEQGSAKLRSSEVIGESGKLLTAFIASKNKTRTVTITGSHSPEGLESINSKLAEQRAKVIKDFYYKKMQEFDYKNLADSIEFETKAIFQDWTSFKAELTSYDGLTKEQKDQVLAIVDGTSTFEAKAKEIAKLPFYKTILKNVYPKLRTSQTTILSVKPKKTDSEISVLSTGIYMGKIKLDTLSFDELMYSATLTPILEEKMKIYQNAVKKSDDWTAYNNLGATYMEIASKTNDITLKNEYIAKAKAQLDLAANKDDNATVLTNLSSIYMMSGDFKTANASLEKAQKSGSKSSEITKVINENMGTIAIRNGNYAKAIQLLSGDTKSIYASHNLGLAYLLSKDFSKAETTLEKATSSNPDFALSYYLRAVTSARQSKETAMAVTLSQAVAKDAKLKEKALNDLEFMNFAKSPAFTNALK